MDVDMALSDLINTSKSENILRKSSKFNRTQKKGVPRRQSGGFTKKTQNYPLCHSKGSNSNQVVIPGGDKRNVRVNISNLADSVVSKDLQELFNEFRIRKVRVNFDKKRMPLGTADIELSKDNADRLINNFSRMALDGKELKFSIIETSTIASRVDFRGRKSHEQKRVATKSPRSHHVKKQKLQKKMTTEELDAELDAYMSSAAV